MPLRTEVRQQTAAPNADCSTLPLSSQLQRRDTRCGDGMGSGFHTGHADSRGGGPAARGC